MKRTILSMFILSLLLCFMANRTYALDCAFPVASEAIEQHDGAILATVADVDINSKTNTKTIVVNVKESYKGVTSTTLTLTEDMMWGDSEVGKLGIYYIKKNDDKWHVPLCSYIAITEGYEYSDKQLAELRQYPQIELLEVSDVVNNLNGQDGQNINVTKVTNQPGDPVQIQSNNMAWIVLVSIMLIGVIVIILYLLNNRIKK